MTLFPDPKARYKNLHNAFYEILTKENYRVLFRGMGVVATGAGPAHALYFACYEYAKQGITTFTNGNTVLAQGQSLPLFPLHCLYTTLWIWALEYYFIVYNYCC